MVSEAYIIGCYVGEKLRKVYNSTRVRYKVADELNGDGRPVHIKFDIPGRTMKAEKEDAETFARYRQDDINAGIMRFGFRRL